MQIYFKWAIARMSNLKHLKLRDDLLRELESGKFQPGDRFYSEKELAARFNISCGTVTRTLNEMSEEGYFERRRREGTFVLDSPGDHRVLIRTLYINMQSMFDLTNHNRSTFVFEEIRRGVINSYPGPVRIESFQKLVEMRRKGEKFPAVIIDCGDYQPDDAGVFEDDVLINLSKTGFASPNRITFEPFSGIFAAIQHLALGCKRTRIGFLGGASRKYFAERFFAYRTALEALNLQYNEAWVRRGIFDVARDEARALLTQPERPDAIFADSAGKARDVIDIALELNIRVPEDLAVVEFDNAPGADTYKVPLTSVSVPYYQLGELAVKMLLERWKTGSTADCVSIGCDLIVRQSTQKTGEHK